MSDEKMYAHIVRTPGVCGGKPRLEGHRIKVQDLVIEHEQLGMSPDEICEAHPGVTLAEIYSALAYYFDHRDEILADIQVDDKFIEEFKHQHPQTVR